MLLLWHFCELTAIKSVWDLYAVTFQEVGGELNASQSRAPATAQQVRTC